MTDQKIRVGITLGDIGGIGPEVAVKALADSRICELCTPVVYGSRRVVARYAPDAEGGENFQYTAIGRASEAKPKRVNLVTVLDEGLEPRPGIATPEAGRAAVAMLRAAVADLKAGHIDAVVTGPINKENVQGPDFAFTGHTEFFGAEFGGQPLMMMCSDLLKVGLVTTHLPLAEVSGSITVARIREQLGRLRRSLIADFGVVEPRIAVMSLNPHTGDGGLLGSEEETVIRPAIMEAIGDGVLAFGPMAADGFFASMGYAKYDAVLAMYHDQGLAPFKALTPEGVNFTAGLSVVRTSPDHGVAYDIAGQGKADPGSMREAIYMATDIVRSRAAWAEMSRNPLKHYEREHAKKDISVKDLLPEQEDQ